MFGKYTPESVKGISAQRTENCINIIKKSGGEVKSMYVLLGENDLVFIVDLPGINEAMKASVGLNKLTGISFSTSPAVTVEEFDKLIT
jgi:uncharacterized protein with GYD domain